MDEILLVEGLAGREKLDLSHGVYDVDCVQIYLFDNLDLPLLLLLFQGNLRKFQSKSI